LGLIKLLDGVSIRKTLTKPKSKKRIVNSTIFFRNLKKKLCSNLIKLFFWIKKKEQSLFLFIFLAK
jgi:hypothetical protein